MVKIDHYQKLGKVAYLVKSGALLYYCANDLQEKDIGSTPRRTLKNGAVLGCREMVFDSVRAQMERTHPRAGSTA